MEKKKIVICNPASAVCISPVYLHSNKTLEEHIEFIRENQIKKALIVAEDIGFLPRCPSLEDLTIIPAVSAENFDYSPLYEMPCIKRLCCDTIYGEQEEKTANIDYSRLQCAVEHLSVDGVKGHQRISTVQGIKKLHLSQGQPESGMLGDSIPTSSLEILSLLQSSLRTLDGIEQAGRLQRLSLSYNFKLTDISALSATKDSLIHLEIESCGKIKDFSVLSELHNLRILHLKGSNVLPNLGFLKHMPHLHYLDFRMNVEDGDLTLCKRIPYIRIQNRKHYNLKDKDLSKNYAQNEILSFFDID